MRFARLFSAAALAAAAAAPTLAACGSAEPSSHSPTENAGTIRAALSATGPDGATYSIGSNMQLLLTPVGADASAASQLFFTDGVATQTFSVPPGSYTGVLEGGTPKFTLSRTAAGMTSSATATLLDPQPYAINVVAGQTTALTFHFALAGVGNVTFSTGSLATGIAVAGADASPPGSGSVHGSLFIQGVQQFDPTHPGNAGITNLVSSGSPVNFSFNAGAFTITGPFAAGVDSVCAPITASQLAVTNVVPAASNVGALFAEASGPMAAGIICFYDANFQIPNAVVIQWSRNGAAQTSAVQTAMGSSGEMVGNFNSLVIAQPASPIYNGTTAQFSLLASAQTMTVLQTEIVFDPGLSTEVDALGASSDPTQPSQIVLQLSP